MSAHYLNYGSESDKKAIDALLAKFEAKFVRVEYRSHDSEDDIYFLKLVTLSGVTLDMASHGFATAKIGHDSFNLVYPPPLVTYLYDRHWPGWNTNAASANIMLDALGAEEKPADSLLGRLFSVALVISGVMLLMTVISLFMAVVFR